MIPYFDLFSGIGGFRAGLERAGGFRCVGHCELDPHADEGYRAIHRPEKEERYYRDVKTIDPTEMPFFDLLCAGFPCQSYSISGKRLGFHDPRGALFFEVARLAQARRPAYLLLENVPGLLSHDGGRTFAAILATLSELGYGVEWMVLNSAHFGVPQSRQRVFLVGYLDSRCAGKVFPLFGAGGTTLVQIRGGPQGKRVYDAQGAARTLTASASGNGGKSGLYFVDADPGDLLLIREGTKKGYSVARPGDTVDLSYPNSDTRRGRVGRDIAHTLTTGGHQGVVMRSGRIRRLTPRECLRLQGFADNQIDRLLAVVSDAQAYRQAGNCVTVNVVEAIGRRLCAADRSLRGGDGP